MDCTFTQFNVHTFSYLLQYCMSHNKIIMKESSRNSITSFFFFYFDILELVFDIDILLSYSIIVRTK